MHMYNHMQLFNTQEGEREMDRLTYEEPVMEVVDIEMEDIITNSNELPVIPETPSPKQ